MSAHFSTDVAQEGAAIVIYVRGEIDMETAERLRDVIEPHLGPRQTVVLDLSGVEFTDSALLFVLVQARGSLTAGGGDLMLRNPIYGRPPPRDHRRVARSAPSRRGRTPQLKLNRYTVRPAQ